MKNALAIGYAIKRRAAHKAKGGMMKCAHGGPAMCSAGCYAEGGMVQNPKLEEAHKSVSRGEAMPHMNKRMGLPHHMAKGGMVEEDPSFDSDDVSEDNGASMDYAMDDLEPEYSEDHDAGMEDDEEDESDRKLHGGILMQILSRKK